MKQKLISLLTLLLCVCSGAWATNYYIINGKCNVPLTAGMNSSSYQILKSNGSTVNATTDISSSQTGTASLYYNSTSASYANLTNTSNYSTSSSSSKTMQAVKIESSNTMTITLNSKTFSKMDVIYRCASDKACTLTIDGTGYSTSDKDIHSVSLEKTFATSIAISNSSGKEYQVFVVLTEAETPQELSIKTQPESAEYLEGAAATALTVEAQGGTSPYSYQWYSCDDAEKTNASPITGQTLSSYTPSTSSTGYYYCQVTDNAATPSVITSNVATITVSAASAPSNVSVSGSSSAVRGAEAITLTADVTGGVPTPTIEWFKCDDDMGTNPVSQGEAATLDVATSTVGTYYYYAQATNSTGYVSSAIKTVTIVPKAPTLSVACRFSSSKAVEISKAADENGSAIIMYSVNNGESWDVYSSLNITGTTTVMAKVVQDGLESEVATATYTLFVPRELTTISESKEWDFTTKVSGSVEFTGADQTTEYVYADIEGLSFTSPFDEYALAFTGQYPYRSNSKRQAQNGTLHFKTSVPGTIVVNFSDTGTGSETDPSKAYKRYLNVNGSNTEYWTSRQYAGDGAYAAKLNIVTDPISVPAGDVYIKAQKGDGATDAAIIVTKLTFTPDVSVSVTSVGYATLAIDQALDFTSVTGVEAYTATAEGATVTFNKVTGKVPANTGLLLYKNGGTASPIYVPVATGEIAAPTNVLVANVAGSKIASTTDGKTNFVLKADGEGGAAFYKVGDSGFTMRANTAYLSVAAPGGSSRISISFDEAGEATGIAEVKKAENGTCFNLRGQRVAQPQKGLYIMNGKKVFVK